MASVSGRGFRPGGVLRALVRLVLLIGLGFSAGLLTGILSEEPELLVGHIQGESEAIRLTASQPAIVEPKLDQGIDAVDARSNDRQGVWRTPARDEVSEAMVRPASQRRWETDSVSETVVAHSWAIQVGAFSEETTAQRLADTLHAKGYPVQLLPALGKAGRWRVRIQPISSEVEAREMAVTLKRVERLPTWVLSSVTGSPGS